MRYVGVWVLVALLVPEGWAQEKEKKPPVGPLKEGMVFEGTFKTGEPNKRGILVKPFVINFRLKIESVDGDTFVGRWTWEKKGITEVAGKVTRDGAIYLRYTKDIKGKAAPTFDGQAAGRVSATGLVMRYVRPSGRRIGLIEARVKEPAPESKSEKKSEKDR